MNGPTAQPLTDFDDILQCVHCGLCLDACPTYRELGTEQDSPRGRLYLMRAIWEGNLAASPEVTAPLSRCLDCRACESACPSGVPYGKLFEIARDKLEIEPPSSKWAKALRRFAVVHLLPRRARLLWASRALALFQKLGLAAIALRLTRPFAKTRHLARALELMPSFAGRSFTQDHAGLIPAHAKPNESNAHSPLRANRPEQRPLAALFTGCIMDVAELEIHRASLTVLRACGFDVWIPANQRCCGALAVHNGCRSAARDFAVANYEVFSSPPRALAAILVNAAGCGAQLKSYSQLFADAAKQPGLDWDEFAARSEDILVFLSRLAANKNPFAAWISWPATLFYDAPCHLQHAQKRDSEPRALLAALPGVKLVVLPEASRCCGAAGIYNLQQPQLSDAILERKLDDIEQTLQRHPECKTLLTGNPGCIFQLRYGLKKRGLPLRVCHPIEWIASRVPPNSPATAVATAPARL